MKRRLKIIGIFILSLIFDVRITKRGKVFLMLKKHNRG